MAEGPSLLLLTAPALLDGTGVEHALSEVSPDSCSSATLAVVALLACAGDASGV